MTPTTTSASGNNKPLDRPVNKLANSRTGASVATNNKPRLTNNNNHSTSHSHINKNNNNHAKQQQLRAGYNNKAQSFLSRGAQVIVRMRGLPFTCTAKQVVDFFASGPAKCEVLDKEEGVLFVRNQFDKPTGDAFVLFANEEFAQRALQKHHQHIGPRYVELFRSTVSEVQQVLSILMEQSNQSNLQPTPTSGHHQRLNHQAATNGFQQTTTTTTRGQHQAGRQHSQQATAISAWQRQAAAGGITYAQVATSNYVAPSATDSATTNDTAKVTNSRNRRPVASEKASIQAERHDEAGDLVSSPEASLPKSGSSASSSGSASDTSAFDNNSLNSSSNNSTTGSQASYTKVNGAEEAANDVDVGGASNKNNKATSDQLGGLSSSAQSPVSTLSATSTASSSYKSSHYSGNQQRSRRQYPYNGQANNYNAFNAAAANNPNYHHYHHHFGPNQPASGHTQASLAYLQHHQFQAAQQGAHYLPPSGNHHRHYPPAGPLYMLAPQAYGSYHQQLQAAQTGAHYMPPAGSHRHYPPGSALYMLAPPPPPTAYGSFHQPQQEQPSQQQQSSSQQQQQQQQPQPHHHHQLPAHLAYTPYLPFQFYSPPPP